MQGVNLVNRDNPNTADLLKWYNGPTLVDLLGRGQFHSIQMII